MKRLLLAVFFACSFFIPVFDAEAEPFISAYAGTAIPHTAETTFTMYNESINLDFDMNSGLLVGANTGIWFDKNNLPFLGFMVDFNASYPELDKLSYGGYSVDVNGDVNVYQATANILLRVPTGPIRPYIGAGGGMYWMDMEDSDSDTAGGWQVLAGANVPLESISKNLSAFAEYRYTAASFDSKDGWTKVTIDYNASQVFGGLAWHFN